MRPKYTFIRAKGRSRTTIYRRIKRELAVAGCYRCPTEECAHNAPTGSNSGMFGHKFNVAFRAEMPLLSAGLWDEISSADPTIPSPQLSPIYTANSPATQVQQHADSMHDQSDENITGDCTFYSHQRGLSQYTSFYGKTMASLVTLLYFFRVSSC